MSKSERLQRPWPKPCSRQRRKESLAGVIFSPAPMKQPTLGEFRLSPSPFRIMIV